MDRLWALQGLFRFIGVTLRRWKQKGLIKRTEKVEAERSRYRPKRIIPDKKNPQKIYFRSSEISFGSSS